MGTARIRAGWPAADLGRADSLSASTAAVDATTTTGARRGRRPATACATGMGCRAPGDDVGFARPTFASTRIRVFARTAWTGCAARGSARGSARGPGCRTRLRCRPPRHRNEGGESWWNKAVNDDAADPEE